MQVQTKVKIMVEVCACRDDPINVAALDERDDSASAQAGRSQGAGQTHADESVISQHFTAHQLAAFSHSAGIIGQKSLVNEVGDVYVGLNAAGVEAREFFQMLTGFFFHIFPIFGHGNRVRSS